MLATTRTSGLLYIGEQSLLQEDPSTLCQSKKP